MRNIATILISLSILSVAYLLIDFSNQDSNEAEPIYSEKYEQWLIDRYKDPATGKIPKNIRQMELNYAMNMRKSKSISNKNGRIQGYNSWVSRGPYFMGGRTRAVALDINDENRILAGGVDAGMWLSSDGGSNWKKTTLPSQFPSVTTIDQDKRSGKQNIWYHGTGERIGNRMSGNGIYKSTDNGESWNRLNSTVKGSISSYDNPFDFVFRVRTNPTAPQNEDQVYAAVSNGGIFRSSDGGNVWEPVLGGGVSNNLSLYTDIEVTSKGVFYATMSSNSFGTTKSIVKGIFRSTNGSDWTNITPDNFPPTFNRVVIGIDPQNENKVYFLAETPGYGLLTTNPQQQDLWHSLFRYEYIKDDGAGSNGKWTDLTQNLPKPELVRHQMNSQGGYDLLIKVHPADSNLVYIGGVNLYRSDTGWQTKDFKVVGGTCPNEDCDYNYRYTNHHADQHTLIFSPSNPNIAYTGTDGGVHKTLDDRADAPEWISLNNGYLTTQFYSVGIDHATTSGDIVGGLQDNGTIFSHGSDSKSLWYDVLRGDGFACAIADSSKFLITTKNSSYTPDINIFMTTVDGQGNLKKGARIDPIGGKDFIWNTPFVLDPNDNNKLYLAGGRTVWRNSDLSKIEMFDFPDSGWMTIKKTDSTATEWTELKKTSVDLTDSNSQRITAIAVSKTPANVVYYGTNNGKMYRIDNADKGNPTPVNITSPSFIGNAYVSSISIDPDDASKVLMCFSNYNIQSIYYTTDSGNNWTPVGGNLETNYYDSSAAPAVNVVKIIKNKGRTAYLAGTSIGLFLTTFLNSTGTDWSQDAELTIGYNNVFTIDYRAIDGYTVLGTYATGAYGTYFNNFPSPPNSIKLLSPANNSKNLKDNVNFKWTISPNTFYYKLQVSIDENFQNIVYEKPDINNIEQVVNTLSLGFKKYYWRVAAINSGGISEYSDVWSFQTGLGAPDLLLPENGATNIGNEVNLEWEKFPTEVTGYRVQIGSNSFFTKIIDEAVTQENQHTFTNLEKGQRYFWRVRAFAGNDSSDYGDKYSFSTEPVSSVDNKQMEQSITLYPNPANNYIKLDLKQFGKLPNSIKLYNSQGRVLKSYDYKIKSAVLNYDFDIQSLNAGQYFIRLEFDKYNINKKFIKL